MTSLLFPFRSVSRLQAIKPLRLDSSILSRANLPALGEFQLGGVRGKKSTGGGTTRNKAGYGKGKKRGLKVYDGQRVQEGTTLCMQTHIWYHPGWNVRFGSLFNNLKAMCHGRVMVTVEKCKPRLKFVPPTGEDPFEVEETLEETRAKRAFPQHVRGKNNFRAHVHIIPDEQHQYFKLVERI